MNCYGYGIVCQVGPSGRGEFSGCLGPRKVGNLVTSLTDIMHWMYSGSNHLTVPLLGKVS